MVPAPVTRRSALGTAVAALLPTALAGCSGSTNVASGPTASLSMAPVTVEALPSKVLYSVEDSADSIDGESIAHLFERILNGGATIKSIDPPIPVGRHLLYDGTVYQLSREVLQREPAHTYVVEINTVQSNGDGLETIRIADLPGVDREKLAAKGLADDPPVGMETSFVYTDAEAGRSALVPEPEYSLLVWDDGERAEWTISKAAERTMVTARYTAERVTTAAEYGRRMREQFAVELTGLPSGQRDIVETAIAEDRYAVESGQSPSAAFVALADRFDAGEQVRALDEDGEGDLGGTYVVEYGGDVYWTVFTDNSDELRATPSA